MLRRAMTMGRNIRMSGAGLAPCLALAACGGSSSGGGAGPSALDPANMVHATSLLYVSATVRPQGSMRSNLVEAIDSVAGSGSAERLGAKIERSRGLKWKQLQSWLGQRIGFALTGFPSNLADRSMLADDAVVVAPTSDPAAARTFLSKNLHQAGLAWKVVGHYAIFGGANAVGQALATTSRTALSASPQYRADAAQLGDGELVTAYAALHPFMQALVPLLSSNQQLSPSAVATAERQAPPGSSAAFGMAALHNQFRIDLVSHGLPHSTTAASAAPTDLASLPADSWLALSLAGSLTNASAMHSLTTTLPQQIARLQALSGATGSVPSAPLRFLYQDLLPALGPIALSVSGTSSSTLKAGLVMSPLDRSAGPRLANAVKQLAAGLPISASATAGRVAVTFGYTSLEQLLAPVSKLADNGTFKSAMGQLPAGARANVYVDFGPIAALASLSGSTSNPSVMRVLDRLSYMIGGGTHSHFRLVLATH